MLAAVPARVRAKPRAIAATRGRANQSRRSSDDAVRAFDSGRRRNTSPGPPGAVRRTTGRRTGRAAGAGPRRRAGARRTDRSADGSSRRGRGCSASAPASRRARPARACRRRPDRVPGGDIPATPATTASAGPRPCPGEGPGAPRTRRGTRVDWSGPPGSRRSGGGCPGRARTTPAPSRRARGGTRGRGATAQAAQPDRRFFRSARRARSGTFLGSGAHPIRRRGISPDRGLNNHPILICGSSVNRPLSRDSPSPQ